MDYNLPIFSAHNVYIYLDTAIYSKHVKAQYTSVQLSIHALTRIRYIRRTLRIQEMRQIN